MNCSRRPLGENEDGSPVARWEGSVDNYRPYRTLSTAFPIESW